jgi:hypothetical protein
VEEAVAVEKVMAMQILQMEEGATEVAQIAEETRARVIIAYGLAVVVAVAPAVQEALQEHRQEEIPAMQEHLQQEEAERILLLPMLMEQIV